MRRSILGMAFDTKPVILGATPGAIRNFLELPETRMKDFHLPHTCNGQIVGQLRKWECRQNVRKMSKNVRKCPKIVQRG